MVKIFRTLYRLKLPWMCIFGVASFLILKSVFMIQGKKSLHTSVASIQQVNCSRNTLFSTRNLSLTALVSFPGSGNTWTRHLIEQMTGLYTGSVYHDKKLIKGGLKGEGRRNGSVVAIKTHHSLSKSKLLFKRAILVIRNPYEAILAEYNRQGQGHMGRKKLQDFADKWQSFVKNKTLMWRELYQSWLSMNDAVFLCYDQMLTDLPSQLQLLEKFYAKGDIPTSLQCALANTEGNFHRTSSGVEHNFIYDTRMIATLNLEIDLLHKMFVKKFGTNTPCDFLSWKMQTLTNTT